jgi:hypothetical protein
MHLAAVELFIFYQHTAPRGRLNIVTFYQVLSK